MERINSVECLDACTRYLIQHMNWSLCSVKDSNLHRDVFRRFANMSELTRDDLRMALMLITEANTEATPTCF